MSHTEGKLHYQQGADVYTHIIRDSNNQYIVRAPQGTDIRDKANARRLVACWNALESVPTDWLENYVADGTKNIFQENAKLKATVDNLLKVIDETDPQLTCFVHEALDALRAIRKEKP